MLELYPRKVEVMKYSVLALKIIFFSVLLFVTSSNAFAQPAISLESPQAGSTLSSQPFNIQLSVDPRSNRYKVFAGDSMTSFPYFREDVATNNYFDSDFVPLVNGEINQEVRLRNVSSDSILLTVVLFYTDRAPAIETYVYNYSGQEPFTPTVGNEFGPISPSAGASVSNTPFQLSLRVDPRSNRYKVFAGDSMTSFPYFRVHKNSSEPGANFNEIK